MNKTVLITGCSSGLGKAAARRFSSIGWNVVASMRNPSAGEDLSKLPGVLVVRLDVQEPESIDKAIKDGLARFGRIDALVNNAGFGLYGVFEATPREKVFEQFSVNVFGVMDVARALLPHFRSNRAGVIVNISSGAGVFTLPMLSLYCASKFALEGFSESLNYELTPLGITVKVIEPGGVVDTQFSRRSGAEAGATRASPDYAHLEAAAAGLFEGLHAAATATQEEVAAVIVEAASDGTDRLRYVATEDIKGMVKARRESSEDAYMNWMRSHFSLALRPVR